MDKNNNEKSPAKTRYRNTFYHLYVKGGWKTSLWDTVPI